MGLDADDDAGVRRGGLALLVLSAVMLTTQAYNPFIYFIF